MTERRSSGSPTSRSCATPRERDDRTDRDADIAWLRLDGWSADGVQVESTAHGLLERDSGSGRIVGLEYWQASTRLPAELLDALPAPPRNTVVIERQPA